MFFVLMNSWNYLHRNELQCADRESWLFYYVLKIFLFPSKLLQQPSLSARWVYSNSETSGNAVVSIAESSLIRTAYWWKYPLIHPLSGRFNAEPVAEWISSNFSKTVKVFCAAVFMELSSWKWMLLSIDRENNGSVTGLRYFYGLQLNLLVISVCWISFFTKTVTTTVLIGWVDIL